MARKTYATGEAQSLLFRTCDITKPELPVLRHGGPCLDWGRLTLVVVFLGLSFGAATLVYAGLG
ncbi:MULTISPECIES: hypothetical protein [unclassified Caulobacter]|uniref:hypothetical protein n=1 Tax=unclassified Caulobacter TaxID=2648921 RepID=UPI000D387467|nr:MULTISPECIES: hypothetical protein [unclassified Caulobacter]PTS90213.1 hypothetical protein DBR21_04590 [Caulobacter sp. HMWF009]PTT12892.1 hypothetical protein DBR10_00745 [Caulobacter sp. HMWF025]PTT80201.1 hypothetical protein DBR41_20425 [Pseudomonas sp. HMWF010]